jgi:rhodanese-related sulfurtransferase
MGLLSFLFGPSVRPDEAHASLQAREAVVLDVREAHEWKAGRIAGAKNVPLSRLRTRAGELRTDRRYIAVCRSGARSARASAQLRKAGFDVVNLKGGMLAWERAGLPLDPRRGRVV